MIQLILLDTLDRLKDLVVLELISRADIRRIGLESLNLSLVSDAVRLVTYGHQAQQYVSRVAICGGSGEALIIRQLLIRGAEVLHHR